MNHEEAKEVGDLLARAIDGFLNNIHTPAATMHKELVRNILWDNKVGISLVLLAWAAHQTALADGASQAAAECDCFPWVGACPYCGDDGEAASEQPK